jgi:phosphatidylserine/phosphatidylglycerophosphate/cardiolipin synthase-like enzyme
MRFQSLSRDGNRFALFSEGAEFFPRMLAAIDAGKHYILAEFYLVASGRVADGFIAAFARARARGVEVRVLFDAFGARGLKEADRVRLRAAGVELVFFNATRWWMLPRLFVRNHRKLLIVDGCVGFTGGVGLGDMFSPDARPDHHWLDCIVEFTGPVLQDWHNLFAGTWARSTGHELDVAPGPVETCLPGERGRLVASSGLGTSEIERSVLKRIRTARTRIWIATAYFWPSRRLRRALRRSARRGLDVRLLLPGPNTDAPAARGAARLYYARLLLSGAVIYEYQPSFMHTKVILCDDWVSMGSSNLDRWGVLWNLEANQEIESCAFARSVADMLARTCDRSFALRSASDVRHRWSVPFWRLIATVILAWSARTVSRLRRGYRE